MLSFHLQETTLIELAVYGCFHISNLSRWDQSIYPSDIYRIYMPLPKMDLMFGHSGGEVFWIFSSWMSKQLMPFFMQTIKLTSMTINQCQFCGPFLPNLKMKNQLENFIPLLFIYNSCFPLHSPFYSMLFRTFNLNFLGKYCQHRCTAQQHVIKCKLRKKHLKYIAQNQLLLVLKVGKTKPLKPNLLYGYK